MAHIEISSSGLNSQNYFSKIYAIKALVEASGHTFGVQLHNSISEGFCSQILNSCEDIKYSVHSPAMATNFLNLAGSNKEAIDLCLQQSLGLLEKVKSNIFLFHGFFLTNTPIVQNMREYWQSMRAASEAKLWLEGTNIIDPEVFNTDLFLAYKEQFIKNLEALRQEYPKLIFCPENDYPGFMSGMQRPQEILELCDEVWLDTGHMWCSSLVHKFDFMDAMLNFVENKRIIGIHLHQNLTECQWGFDKIADTHSHLYFKTELNLKPLVRQIAKLQETIFTLEIIDVDEKDAITLLEWLS